jgi:predicted HTH domain antitoxin
VSISISNEIADKLRKTNYENSLEKSIYYSIALSLFISNSISIQKAASIADCEVNDFIHFLQFNHIPWSLGNKDGYEEYQKSIDDLLIKIDKFIEQDDENN